MARSTLNPTARKIQRTYLLLMLGNTLAASFIWGINTIFLLNAGLTNFEAFAANAFFTYAAFGDANVQRWQLIDQVRKAAKTRRANTVNVGDTTRDVEAGQRAGIRTIGVGTGWGGERELKAVGAYATLPDLKDSKKFLRLVD